MFPLRLIRLKLVPIIATLGMLVVTYQGAHAQTETVLYSFCSERGCVDGNEPEAGLIMKKGKLYGTTAFGGANNAGTVFELSASGKETALYSFGNTATDGLWPFAGLIMDKKGNLYGTTYAGGGTGCGGSGCGTVFEISPNGTETVLHSVHGKDGGNPEAGLIMDKKGDLFGTTSVGGANDVGVVFELSPSGTETVLHSFANDGTDGFSPWAGVMMDRKGDLYGTTHSGGTDTVGTLFKLSSSGTETILHSFVHNGTDGYWPYAGQLIMDKKGDLYGTTQFGGANNLGTVFELDSSGTETVLYSFCSQSGCTDGRNPLAGLVMDTKGNLYGTTYSNGASGQGCGTVFELSPGGTETVLHSFANNGTDGCYPAAGLIIDKKGNLYGTTVEGGVYGDGTVFKVTP